MNKNNSTQAASTQQPADVDTDLVVVVDGEEAVPIAVEGGIAVIDENALVTADVAEDWKLKMPKAIRDLFQATPVLVEGQLSALIDNLPTDDADACRRMFEALNPVREGVVSSTADVRIPSARIFQGIGDDPAKPDTAPVGSLYSSNRELLLVADPAQARMCGAPTTITVAVILLIKSRTWWKPKRASFVPPTGVDPTSKAPICQSPDRVTGSRFGTCAACPHRPFAKGAFDPDACTDDAIIYFVIKGFKGIYSMPVKGASLKLAVAAIERSKGKLWDQWFDLSLAPQSNSSGKWYVVAAKTHSTDAAPQGLATTPQERFVFKALSSMMLHEAVAPSFARVYDAKGKSAGDPAGGGEVSADPAAIAAAASADLSSSGTL